MDAVNTWADDAMARFERQNATREKRIAELEQAIYAAERRNLRAGRKP